MSGSGNGPRLAQIPALFKATGPNLLAPVSTLCLVRAEGLEPPRLSPLEPKSSASTNSATPAKGFKTFKPNLVLRGAGKTRMPFKGKA